MFRIFIRVTQLLPNHTSAELLHPGKLHDDEHQNEAAHGESGKLKEDHSSARPRPLGLHLQTVDLVGPRGLRQYTARAGPGLEADARGEHRDAAVHAAHRLPDRLGELLVRAEDRALPLRHEGDGKARANLLRGGPGADGRGRRRDASRTDHGVPVGRCQHLLDGVEVAAKRVDHPRLTRRVQGKGGDAQLSLQLEIARERWGRSHGCGGEGTTSGVVLSSRATIRPRDQR
mmetsp:Transcript_86107/g.233378  ORF Transcript_86107/g.233378 Transcript_86107/m.233378 type:complete len:231 (-) Transcript_86107:79-771(-)